MYIYVYMYIYIYIYIMYYRAPLPDPQGSPSARSCISSCISPSRTSLSICDSSRRDPRRILSNICLRASEACKTASTDRLCNHADEFPEHLAQGKLQVWETHG